MTVRTHSLIITHSVCSRSVYIWRDAQERSSTDVHSQATIWGQQVLVLVPALSCCLHWARGFGRRVRKVRAWKIWAWHLTCLWYSWLCQTRGGGETPPQCCFISLWPDTIARENTPMWKRDQKTGSCSTLDTDSQSDLEKKTQTALAGDHTAPVIVKRCLLIDPPTCGGALGIMEKQIELNWEEKKKEEGRKEERKEK